jgi:hypothetical protein
MASVGAEKSTGGPDDPKVSLPNVEAHGLGARGKARHLTARRYGHVVPMSAVPPVRFVALLSPATW